MICAVGWPRTESCYGAGQPASAAQLQLFVGMSAPAGWKLAGLLDFAVRCMTGVFLLPALGSLAHSLLWVGPDMSSECACLLHS